MRCLRVSLNALDFSRGKFWSPRRGARSEGRRQRGRIVLHRVPAQPEPARPAPSSSSSATATRASRQPYRRLLKAPWQRRRVHVMRNALAYASKTQRRMVSAAIGTVFVQESADAARAQWRSVADQLRGTSERRQRHCSLAPQGLGHSRASRGDVMCQLDTGPGQRIQHVHRAAVFRMAAHGQFLLLPRPAALWHRCSRRLACSGAPLTRAGKKACTGLAQHANRICSSPTAQSRKYCLIACATHRQSRRGPSAPARTGRQAALR